MDLSTVLLVTLAAGLATGLGAVPLLFREQFGHRTYDSALGLAAGVMIAASFWALILPGTELGTIWEVVVGVALGGGFLLVGNYAIPHLHGEYRRYVADGLDAEPEEMEIDSLRRAVLVGGAIVLHNGPEGLAIGVAFASGMEEAGVLLAVVIAIQNVPDGFAFAVPAAETGISKAKVLLYTTLSGAVPQPVAAAVGFLLVEAVTGLFPVAAGFAAGAMIAVVFREMVPSSHGHGYADEATAAFVLGVVLILVVDSVLAV